MCVFFGFFLVKCCTLTSSSAPTCAFITSLFATLFNKYRWVVLQRYPPFPLRCRHMWAVEDGFLSLAVPSQLTSQFNLICKYGVWSEAELLTSKKSQLFPRLFPAPVIKTKAVFWGAFLIYLAFLSSFLVSLFPASLCCLFDTSPSAVLISTRFILYVRQLLHILSEQLLWSTFVTLETGCLKLGSFEVADVGLF